MTNQNMIATHAFLTFCFYKPISIQPPSLAAGSPELFQSQSEALVTGLLKIDETYDVRHTFR